jgi:hypothetical protein
MLGFQNSPDSQIERAEYVLGVVDLISGAGVIEHIAIVP